MRSGKCARAVRVVAARSSRGRGGRPRERGNVPAWHAVRWARGPRVGPRDDCLFDLIIVAAYLLVSWLATLARLKRVGVTGVAACESRLCVDTDWYWSFGHRDLRELATAITATATQLQAAPRNAHAATNKARRFSTYRTCWFCSFQREIQT